jgi:hypothetical protein
MSREDINQEDKMHRRDDLIAVSELQARRTLESTLTFEMRPPNDKLAFHGRLSIAYHIALSNQLQIDADQAMQSLQDDGLAADFLNQVAFPEFVDDLIKGTFNAIVDSSFRQMRDYLELIEAASAPISKFVDAISEKAARDYLDSIYDDGEDDGDKPKKRRYTQSQLKAAKLALARQQRRLLRQVILIGIARVLVDTPIRKTFLGIKAQRDAFNPRLREKIIHNLQKPSHKTARTVAPLSTELSGAIWVMRFPGSNSIDDLEVTFRTNVKRFIAALTGANAGVIVTSTFRPPERAYLMHWSWKIVKGLSNGRDVPLMPGVSIIWWHGNLADSIRAALEMVNGYGIGHLQVAPALASRHTQRRAIDMKISWNGNLRIKKANGQSVTITSIPKNGANRDLISVGVTYNVLHFHLPERDVPHWSTDGR